MVAATRYCLLVLARATMWFDWNAGNANAIAGKEAEADRGTESWVGNYRRCCRGHRGNSVEDLD